MTFFFQIFFKNQFLNLEFNFITIYLEIFDYELTRPIQSRVMKNSLYETDFNN